MLLMLCVIFVRNFSRKRLSKRRPGESYTKITLLKIDALHDINAGPYADREVI